MTPAEDPDHPNNSDAYHTGYPCVEGCGRPAGTAWSPLWCQPCNAERLSSVRNSLKDIADHQQNAAQGGEST